MTCEYFEVGGQLRARNLQPCRTVAEIIASAKRWADNGKLSQAIGELQRLLDAIGEHPEGSLLLAKWREESRSRDMILSTLPRGNSLYAQAKRAHLVDNELTRAEQLYRDAIQRGDNADSAIKDLASLLQQTGRLNEAAHVLESHLSRFTRPDERIPILNQLATCSQHAGQLEHAIQFLAEVCLLSPRMRQSEVNQRIAYCQFKMRDFDAAERTLQGVLKESPRNQVAQRRLDALRQARKSGSYTEVDREFEPGLLSQLLYGNSPTLTFFLERCEYHGLRKEVIVSRDFSEETLDSLEGYIQRQGAARPRERAQCYLTGARVLRDIRSEDYNRLRTYLRQYCASMGDSAALERKPMDVVRSFYAEAFLVDQDWGEQLNIKAVQYLLSYVCTQEQLLAERLPSLAKALQQVFAREEPPGGFWDGILHLFVNNHNAAKTLLPIFLDHRKARESSLTYLEGFGQIPRRNGMKLEEFARCWERARTTRHQESDACSRALQTLSPTGLTTAEMELFRATLREHRKTWLCQMDCNRIDHLVNVTETIDQFSKQSAFEERERQLSLAGNQIESLMKDIEDNPTRLAIGALHPLLITLRDKVLKAAEELLQTAQPKVKVALAIDSMAPDRDNLISLRVAVSNLAGCSPISHLELRVHSQPELYQAIDEKYLVSESIRGGETRTVACAVRLTPEAIRMRALSVGIQISYLDRRNEEIDAGTENLSLRLYARAEFNTIPNPFGRFAKGTVVDEEKMFYGRQEILDHIFEALATARAKCFVLYGQKRSGKSSVLYHLRQRLNLSGQFLCIHFSLGDIIADFSVKAFLYRILQEVRSALVDHADAGKPVPDFTFPGWQEFGDGAMNQFIDILECFHRVCRRMESWRDRRVVVTIDEFSYLYGQILHGTVPEAFMKTWKALMERQLFSAVLVGQDVMPKFKQRFPNEFGVTQDERLTYLSEPNTRKLIEDPIRIGGLEAESRFRGRAIDRIRGLTAGNPFYIQILGDRLVRHMNQTHSLYATEVEVAKVARDLIDGENALLIEDFDNLITAGDADIEAIPSNETLAVLRKVAQGSQLTSCPRSAIAGANTPRIEEILEDLVRREVLEQPQEDYYRIRVGLFRDWLLGHP